MSMSKLLTSSIALSALLLVSSCNPSDGSPTSTDTDTQTDTNNTPPNANFTEAALSGFSPFEATFNAMSSTDSDGQIASYLWLIDDEPQTKTGDTLNYTFTEIGLYSVKLIVTDNQGATDEISKVVTVNFLELGLHLLMGHLMRWILLIRMDSLPVINGQLTM